MKSSQIFFAFLYSIFLSSYNYTQVFGDRIDLGVLQFDPISEASGLAASRKNTNVLWTHNDSGDTNRIFALNNQGKHLGIYYINGVEERDWEDIAVGPGPLAGQHYIYIGDIGDNNASYATKYIFRVLEPNVSSTQSPKDTTLLNVETIKFKYPDGKRDAETLMIDPFTKDIYVVSKREDSVRVFLLPYPQSTTQTITATHAATLYLKDGQSPPRSYTVGGDIAANGTEIIIKTRAKIYYWRRALGQNLWDALSSNPFTLPYIEEPQGEAVAWAPDARGYYTTSEETGNDDSAHLYFYPRIDEPYSYQQISLKALLEGFYNGLSMIQDTVIVQLRNSNPPYSIVDQTKIYLDNNGFGTGNLTNAEHEAQYYLVVKHRNALETWSAVTQHLTLGIINYDFTISKQQAYGNNLKKINSEWCLFGGDTNQDGTVNSQDLVLIHIDALNYSKGYQNCDLNGDSFVDIHDLIICDNNVFNSASVKKP